LSTPNIHENQLVFYPEIWVGFKEDLKQDVATLKNNKTRYHNFENKNNDLQINPNTPGINITIKHIEFNYTGYDPDPSNMINYKYSAGKCENNGDEENIYDISQYPSYHENCKTKCDEDELCMGFTLVESQSRGDTPDGSDRLNWFSHGVCKLHKANESSFDKIESSLFTNSDYKNYTKKYLQNIPDNEQCFIATDKTVDANAYFNNQRRIKINAFKKAKYKPLRNYLNILSGTDNQEDYPNWMECDIVNDNVVCNNNNTINKFIELINQIREKIFLCNQNDVCRGGYKNSSIIATRDGSRTKIINTLTDIANFDKYDGHNIEYGSFTGLEHRSEMPIETVYFVKDQLIAYIVLFDHFDDDVVTYKRKYNYVKEFAGPIIKNGPSFQFPNGIDRRTHFIVIPLFDYFSCTECTPSKLSETIRQNQNDQNKRMYVSTLRDKLKEINIYTCETQEITTNGWDNSKNIDGYSVVKPRFVQVYPSVRFKGLRLRVKGANPIHIVIGNINDKDRAITKSYKGVIPKSGSGIQISMDVHLQDGLGSYILKKNKNTLSYDMLSEFTSKSNEQIKSNVRYIGGDDDLLPKITVLSLDDTNINSLLGVSKHDQYDSNGHLQDTYQYNKNNGVAGLYQSFVFDFDENNNKLYVMYKSSVSSDYSLLMDVNVNFAEVLGHNYKLYVVSEVGVASEHTTNWQADLFKYENNTNKPRGEDNCYDIISYEQNRPEKLVPLIQEVPNYTGRGAGKCKTTNDKIPPFRSIDLKYNPLTNDDLDLRQDNDQTRLAAYKACSAFCSPEPNGVNKTDDCIGFELDKHTEGYICHLYANKSHRELGLRMQYYENGRHRITDAEECPDVCDAITKTYKACEKYPNGCTEYDDRTISTKRCYSRDNANIITTQQLNEEKQLATLIEQQRRQESIDKMNSFRQTYTPRIPEKTICPENEFITSYNNCICPNNKPVKYMPLYDNNGDNINQNRDLKCGTQNDVPQKCGIREFNLVSQQQKTAAVDDPTCVCPYGRIKVNDGGDYWCDLPRDEVVDWSDCIPEEDDPRNGIRFKSTEVSFIGQGDVSECKSTNQGRKITIDEQSFTPNNLSLDYWIKAFRNAGKGDENGCNSSWFTDDDDYVWDKYKNGIDFYNDNKNNNFDYQYLLNWAEARLNEGNGVCNNRWRGPEGKCVATWEKTNVTDDYYTCQTDSGQCIIQNHNKKQTEMDPNLIDVVFNKSQNGKNECEIKCPIISHALNDGFTQSTLPDDAPTSWHHGTCDNLWSGGKRHVYWVCEPDKGSGVYGVKPVLLTEDRAANDPTIKNYISNTKEDAIIECTPYPPEYEGPQIDYHDHISYISAIDDQFDVNELARFPKEFANENNMKNWHDANPLEKHVEIYGDKVLWFEEMLRYKTRDSGITGDPGNQKCKINLDDINVYEKPRKHLVDYINAGHPEECIEAKETYNDMNELQDRIYGQPDAELGEIFYVRSTNTAYMVERGRNGGFIPNKWDTSYNYNNTHPSWPNIEDIWGKYNYSMRIVQYDANCVGAKDRTKLNFNLKWGKNNGNYVTDPNDSTLSFFGYAQHGAQLSPTDGGSNVNSLYNCAQSCRDQPECKYFTYYPGKGSGYFKGYGAASVYPSNSYPRTYHGSSFGGVAHEAASKFFDPISPYNQSNYNGNPNLFGFFRRGKKNLTPLEARKMGCTWATGVNDRDGSIDNDTNMWPITLMINHDIHSSCEKWGCRGDVFLKSGSIPGLNEDILFPYWFIDNSSFNFLNDSDVSFPIEETTAYKKLEKIANEHPQHIQNFNNHVAEIVRIADDNKASLQEQINKLDEYKVELRQANITDPNHGYSTSYTIEIERRRKTSISSSNMAEKLSKEKKLKEDKRSDAQAKLPILAKQIIDSNTVLFNKIPVGYSSPFQRYNSNGQKDSNGPKLLYIVPPMVNETKNGVTERNIAVYRHTEINDANINILAISCNDMMDNNDKLNNNNCRNNVNQPCNTNNVLSGTINYKGSNDNLAEFWTTISRTGSGGNNEPTCELFNFNVDDPVVSQNNFRRTVSGVLTDRSKYTGTKIRSRKFYDNQSPNWAENNPNVNVKQIGKRYLVTSDKSY
jgi:hypothetical protein